MSNNLQLFFTGVVALATLVYAYLTYVFGERNYKTTANSN